MATAKKSAPKAVTTVKTTAPAKAVKPLATVAAPKKAPVSKTANAIAKLTANIAKLTERKNKMATEINTLRDQRTALKATPAPAAAPAKTAAKPVSKPAIKKMVAKK